MENKKKEIESKVEKELETLRYPINQQYANEKFAVYMNDVEKWMTEPLKNGDEIVKIMEDRWRTLEDTDIDEDKDVMYYRAHVSIKDVYAGEIF